MNVIVTGVRSFKLQGILGNSILYSIDWWMLTHVSEKHAVFMFRVVQEVCLGYPEDGGSKLLKNVTVFQ